MELLNRTGYIDDEQYKKILNSCGQIRRMLISSINTVKEKAKKYIAVYDIEHKNPQGELVLTEKVELLDCFLAFDEAEDVQEVYSSTTKNETSLCEEEFYQTITNQCNDEEMYSLRYEEFN